MEHNRPPPPICTIKLNFKCCAKCPIKLKDKVQKLDGVQAVNLDPEQGLLRVQGNIDPIILTNKVKTFDKKAELWSFQKDPSKNILGSSSSSKYNVEIGKDCCPDGDGVDEPSSDEEINRNNNNNNNSIIVPKKKKGILSWVKRGNKKDDKAGFGMGLGLSTGMHPPRPGFRPPMSSSMGIPANRQFHGPPRPGYRPPNPYHPSMMYPTPSPALYGHYGGQMMPPPYTNFLSMEPPKVNPIVHYTSYADNYRYL